MIRVIMPTPSLLCLGWVENDSSSQNNGSILFCSFILTLQSKRLSLAFHLLGKDICKFLIQCAKSNSAQAGVCPKSTFCTFLYHVALFRCRKHTYLPKSQWCCSCGGRLCIRQTVVSVPCSKYLLSHDPEKDRKFQGNTCLAVHQSPSHTDLATCSK